MKPSEVVDLLATKALKRAASWPAPVRGPQGGFALEKTDSKDLKHSQSEGHPMDFMLEVAVFLENFLGFLTSSTCLFLFVYDAVHVDSDDQMKRSAKGERASQIPRTMPGGSESAGLPQWVFGCKGCVR